MVVSADEVITRVVRGCVRGCIRGSVRGCVTGLLEGVLWCYYKKCEWSGMMNDE